jgi:hypothetical protein
VKLLIPAALLLLFAIPSRALCQQPISPDDLKKKYGPNVQIIEDVDTAKASGVGGHAIGDKATIDQSHSTAPSVPAPWGGMATGGSADTSATAEMVTHSLAFRIAAGIVGGLCFLLGISIFQQGNPRGAVIVGGSGLCVLIGAILFPEWLTLALLAFFFFNITEYAYAHGRLTGALASIVTAVHSADEAVSKGFVDAVADIAETSEINLINKHAKRNDASSIRIPT